YAASPSARYGDQYRNGTAAPATAPPASHSTGARRAASPPGTSYTRTAAVGAARHTSTVVTTDVTRSRRTCGDSASGGAGSGMKAPRAAPGRPVGVVGERG